MAETAGKNREKRMEALAGAGLGLVLLLVCSGLLWRLEGRPEGKEDRQAVEVLELEADGSTGPVPSGRLVHLSGLVETPEVLTDSLTGSSVQALGIRREVEYFQWVEVLRPAAASSDGPRKAEDYAYHQRWVAEPVDSSAFHSEEARRRFANMTLVRLTNESRYAGDARLGVYRLPSGLTASLPAGEPFAVTVSDSLRDEIYQQAAQAHRSAGRGPLQLSNVVHAQGGIVYIGAGGTPQNGDVRVVYSQIPPMRASLAGAVQGTDIVAWRGEGGEICRLLPGVQTAQEMLPELTLSGTSPAAGWGYRLAAVLTCACAFFLILRPLRRPLRGNSPCTPRMSRLWGGGSLLLGLLWTAALIWGAAQAAGPGI